MCYQYFRRENINSIDEMTITGKILLQDTPDRKTGGSSLFGFVKFLNNFSKFLRNMISTRKSYANQQRTERNRFLQDE